VKAVVRDKGGKDLWKLDANERGLLIMRGEMTEKDCDKCWRGSQGDCDEADRQKQKQGKARWKERPVIHNEDDVGRQMSNEEMRL